MKHFDWQFLFLMLLISICISSCCKDKAKMYEESIRNKMVDKNATLETVALYDNLDKLSNDYILFGHQAATEYGRGWYGDEDRSDVKDATGSHPAVVGHDFQDFTYVDQDASSIKNAQARLAKLISEQYNRGGLVTIAWHFPNPIKGAGNSFYWDVESVPAVSEIIPGGADHETYKEILGRIGDFAHLVKGAKGESVPMIFRPYHELDGDWFWWGAGHVSRADFIRLWQFTVSYLRDSLDVHNFIYAFSPDCKYNTEDEYLERYPGDEWVDLVGVDNYHDFGRDADGSLEAGGKKLQIVSDYAKRHNKLAAFTETGLESIPDTVWWTNTLLKTLKNSGAKLTYVLVWRNDSQSETHYYASPAGHPSHADFMRFYNDSYTLFNNDLSNIYVLKNE
ncbi:MAG: glycoside hydrolase family 26 protein [Dysgonamonadaceae bacterium]|jgi:mannan endo-1,4-beta-mannosidase|nr:glycoside hydrolase family 26 protein [Dysgonamonadaceae bacterium]